MPHTPLENLVDEQLADQDARVLVEQTTNETIAEFCQYFTVNLKTQQKLRQSYVTPLEELRNRKKTEYGTGIEEMVKGRFVRLRHVLLLIGLLCLQPLPIQAETDEKNLDRLAIVPFDSPDPTAIQMPGKQGVYVFTTGRGIPILYSEDMFEWKRIGRVFQENLPAWAAERIKGARAIWAPDIVHLNGLYHVYYSVSTFGGQRSLIALAVNKTLDPNDPDYAWEDRGIVLESLPDVTDYNAIDSALFVDDNGKAYLFWGSYWTGLKAVEVDPKTGKPFRYQAGEWKIPEDYIAVAGRESKRDTSIEAPYVIRRGDWYYLFTSRGS